MTTSPEVVVIEDEPNLRELVRDLLADDGIEVRTFETIAAVEPLLLVNAPDLLIIDVKLPDGDGLEFLDRLREAGVRTPAIVMTAFGTLERAVQALKAGASDFLVKPFDNQRMRSAVAAALEGGERLEELELRAGTVRVETEVSRSLIGSKGGLQDVVALLPRVAACDATVLVHGESGTGKELIARAVHAHSPRRDGPFVSLNCAAIMPTLLESELFGFERGAFTGAHAQRKGHIESADGGTLFLDEIGDMSVDAQARLLRVIQEREITRVGGREPVDVDVRVIAATHRDLAERVRDGHFREDLLYRLNVVPIELPPLRARKQDIPGLVRHFMDKAAVRHRVSPLPVDGDLIERLCAHEWPGNVRELENLVERAAILGGFDFTGIGSAPARPAASAEPEVGPDEPVRPLKEVVREAERQAVVGALRAAGGNKAQAARLLGVSYKTLFNKINEHGIRATTSIE